MAKRKQQKRNSKKNRAAVSAPRSQDGLALIVEQILTCPDDRWKIAAAAWWAKQEKTATAAWRAQVKADKEVV